jgi:hypothetical protein
MTREETTEISDAESLLMNVSALTGERLRRNRSENPTEPSTSEMRAVPISRSLTDVRAEAVLREFPEDGGNAVRQANQGATGNEQLLQELRRLREDNSVILDGIKSLSERDGGDEPVIEAVTLE